MTEPTEDEMNELADWIATRPPAVVAVMDRFPPASYVKAKDGMNLIAPAPGVIGQIFSYQHSRETDEVTINVMARGEFLPLAWKAECEPDWPEVVDSEKQREWYERAKEMRKEDEDGPHT